METDEASNRTKAGSASARESQEFLDTDQSDVNRNELSDETVGQAAAPAAAAAGNKNEESAPDGKAVEERKVSEEVPAATEASGSEKKRGHSLKKDTLRKSQGNVSLYRLVNT